MLSSRALLKPNNYIIKNLKNFQSTVNLVNCESVKPFEEIPGPKPLPVIGNKWKFLFGEYSKLDFLEFQKRLYETYGPIVLIRKAFGADLLYLFNPNDIEMVYRNDGKFPKSHNIPTLSYYRKSKSMDDLSLLTTTQIDKWYRVRTVLNPLLQFNIPKRHASGLNLIAEEFVTKMKHIAELNPKNELPENFSDEIYKVVMEFMYYFCFSSRLGMLENVNEREANRIIKLQQVLVGLIGKMQVTKYWQHIKTMEYRRFVSVCDEMFEKIERFCDDIERKFELNKKPEQEMTVYEKLLTIDRNIARMTAMDFLGPGTDNICKGLNICLYYIAKNKEKQDKLREELTKLLPEKNSPITSDVLSEAKYLKATIKEVLRITPPILTLHRITNTDVVLSGYEVPKGTSILMGISFLSLQKDNYTNPDQFIPERWLKTTTGELSYKNANPFAYLPFGFGTRNCIGMRIANLKMEVLVAKIVRNFTLDWKYGEAKFSRTMFNTIASPLKITLTENK